MSPFGSAKGERATDPHPKLSLATGPGGGMCGTLPRPLSLNAATGIEEIGESAGTAAEGLEAAAFLLPLRCSTGTPRKGRRRVAADPTSLMERRHRTTTASTTAYRSTRVLQTRHTLGWRGTGIAWAEAWRGQQSTNNSCCRSSHNSTRLYRSQGGGGNRGQGHRDRKWRVAARGEVGGGQGVLGRRGRRYFRLGEAGDSRSSSRYSGGHQRSATAPATDRRLPPSPPPHPPAATPHHSTPRVRPPDLRLRIFTANSAPRSGPPPSSRKNMRSNVWKRACYQQRATGGFTWSLRTWPRGPTD